MLGVNPILIVPMASPIGNVTTCVCSALEAVRWGCSFKLMVLSIVHAVAGSCSLPPVCLRTTRYTGKLVIQLYVVSVVFVYGVCLYKTAVRVFVCSGAGGVGCASLQVKKALRLACVNAWRWCDMLWMAADVKAHGPQLNTGSVCASL